MILGTVFNIPGDVVGNNMKCYNNPFHGINQLCECSNTQRWITMNNECKCRSAVLLSRNRKRGAAV